MENKMIFQNPMNIIFIARRIKLNSEDIFAFEKLILKVLSNTPA